MTKTVPVLTKAQQKRVEKEHDERMAARLAETLSGDRSESFTTHEVSPARRAASLARAASMQT